MLLSKDAGLHLHFLEELGRVGHEVHGVDDAALAASVVGRIDPVVADGHLGHLPATHVKEVVPLEGEFHEALAADAVVHFLAGGGIADVGHAVGVGAAAVSIAGYAGTGADVVDVLDGFVVLAAGAQALGIAQVHVSEAKEYGAVGAFFVTVERGHAAVSVAGVGGVPVGGVEAGVAVHVELGGHFTVVGVGVEPGGTVEGYTHIEAGLAVGPLLEGLVGVGLEEGAVGVERVFVVGGPAVVGGIGDSGVLVIVGVVADAEALVGEVQVHHFLGGSKAQSAADALVLAALVEGGELVVEEVVVGQADEDLLRVVREVGDGSGLAVGLIVVDGAVGVLHHLEGVIAAVKLVQELLVGVPGPFPLGLFLGLVLREQLGAVGILDAGIVGVAVEKRAGGVEQCLCLEGLADAFVHSAQIGVTVFGRKVFGRLVQLGDNEVDVLVYRISFLEQFLDGRVQRKGFFPEDGHRTVAAEDVEVEVGSEGTGLCFPQGAVGLAGTGTLVHVGDEGAGLGDALIVEFIPVVDPAGGGVSRAQ